MHSTKSNTLQLAGNVKGEALSYQYPSRWSGDAPPTFAPLDGRSCEIVRGSYEAAAGAKLGVMSGGESKGWVSADKEAVGGWGWGVREGETQYCIVCTVLRRKCGQVLLWN